MLQLHRQSKVVSTGSNAGLSQLSRPAKLQKQQATQCWTTYLAVQTQEAVTHSLMALWKHSYTSICHALIP